MWRLGCSSEKEFLPSMNKDLGLGPSNKKQKDKNLKINALRYNILIKFAFI